jgi:putative transposase
VRFVFNHFLNKRIEKYKAGEGFYNFYEACKDLTELKKAEGYEWLQEADSHSLQNALKNMNCAYLEFYRRVREKKGAPGFPKFKKKRETRRSYTSQAQAGKEVIYLTDKKIKLPKLGTVKCKISRQVEGRILSASICQTPGGKYYVSVCCTEYEPRQLEQTGAAVGLHFGIKPGAVTSEGEVIENRRFLEKAQKRISRLQRRVSRKPSGSANREKARIKLAKAYERVKNRRTDTLQKLTTNLLRNYDTICVRDGEFAQKFRNRLYAYYLSDASWGMFVRLLKYKCAWYGKTLITVDARYPSVRTCHSCGCKNTALTAKQPRKWVCPECGATHERAENAAKNTLDEGLRFHKLKFHGTGGRPGTHTLAENM